MNSPTADSTKRRRASSVAATSEKRADQLQHRPMVDDVGLAQAGGGEGRHLVPLPSAQQLVDRHAQHLALDVVQRDVDGRDRRRQHAAALEILAAVHLLPDRPDPARVTADQELAVVLQGTYDRLLAA